MIGGLSAPLLLRCLFLPRGEEGRGGEEMEGGVWGFIKRGFD